MIDEVAKKRQERCAKRPQGHTLTQKTHGVCSNCLIRVDPPEPKKKTSTKGK